MKKRVIWAILAVLGFSTACSTVKQTATQSDEQSTEVKGGKDGELEAQRIRLMYGVPSPAQQQAAAEAESNDKAE